MPEDGFGTFGEGLPRELPDDPAAKWADRAIQALYREFAADAQCPRFVIVVETPPDGEVLTTHFGNRLGLASSGDDEIDTHRLLLMAALAVRRSMSGEIHTRAVKLWDEMQAEFLQKFVHLVPARKPPDPPRKRRNRR